MKIKHKKRMSVLSAKKEARLILEELDTRVKDFEMRSGLQIYVDIEFKATDLSHPNKYSDNASFRVHGLFPSFSKKHLNKLFGDREKNEFIVWS